MDGAASDDAGQRSADGDSGDCIGCGGDDDTRGDGDLHGSCARSRERVVRECLESRDGGIGGLRGEGVLRGPEGSCTDDHAGLDDTADSAASVDVLADVASGQRMDGRLERLQKWQRERARSHDGEQRSFAKVSKDQAEGPPIPCPELILLHDVHVDQGEHAAEELGVGIEGAEGKCKEGRPQCEDGARCSSSVSSSVDVLAGSQPVHALHLRFAEDDGDDVQDESEDDLDVGCGVHESEVGRNESGNDRAGIGGDQGEDDGDLVVKDSQLDGVADDQERDEGNVTDDVDKESDFAAPSWAAPSSAAVDREVCQDGHVASDETRALFSWTAVLRPSEQQGSSSQREGTEAQC
eukprot:1761143-Pleurochrysis_carterae.AAC.3